MLHDEWEGWKILEARAESGQRIDRRKKHVLVVLQEYKRHCGGGAPSIFLEAEFFNKKLGNGRTTSSVYDQLVACFRIAMQEYSNCGKGTVCYIKNDWMPLPLDIYDALIEYESPDGLSACISIALYASVAIKWMSWIRLKDYDKETSVYAHQVKIPYPFSEIVNRQYDRVISCGGNEWSSFYVLLNMGEIVLGPPTYHNSVRSKIRRVSSKAGIDFLDILTSSFASRRVPRDHVIVYRSYYEKLQRVRRKNLQEEQSV